VLRPIKLLARPCRAVVREASSSRLPELPAPVATGVNHQLPGQDFHLLDIDTFHGARRVEDGRGDRRLPVAGLALSSSAPQSGLP